MSNTTVILRGRLTRDPEIAPVGAKQTLLAKFSVACDEGVGDNKKTAYIDCKAWAKVAEDLSGAGKGDPIVVFGRIDQESWEDKATGAKRSKLVVVAEIVDGVARGKTAGAAPAKTASKPLADALADFEYGGPLPF